MQIKFEQNYAFKQLKGEENSTLASEVLNEEKREREGASKQAGTFSQILTNHPRPILTAQILVLILETCSQLYRVE